MSYRLACELGYMNFKGVMPFVGTFLIKDMLPVDKYFTEPDPNSVMGALKFTYSRDEWMNMPELFECNPSDRTDWMIMNGAGDPMVPKAG
jgi:hypothetical protein